MHMYGIGPVLDGTHFALVKSLWAEIESVCGRRSPVPHPYPHFTYQTAEEYDLDRLDAALKRVAAQSTPFRVVTTGLGIFNRGGGLYIAVPRIPQLESHYAMLWSFASEAARTQPHFYYSAGWWVPHITLGFGDRVREKLPELVQVLCSHDLNWSIEINNLTVVYEDDTHKELIGRYDFPGATDPAPPLSGDA